MNSTSKYAARANLRISGVAATLLAVLFGLVVALGAPHSASADESASDLVPPANSFRYADGELRTAAADAPQTIASDSYVRFSQTSDGWQATLAGDPLTINNAKYFGVDVDESNKTIDWARAKRAGVNFALIRCGVGSDSTALDDGQWSANAAGVKANGLPFGVVLYSYATNADDARSEAAHVLRQLRNADLAPEDLDYPVYLDLEQNPTIGTPNAGTLATIAETFCSAIEQAGYRAGVYSSLNWWNNYLTSPVFDQWDRWVAQWLTEGRENAATSYKGSYGIWQCLGTGYVDGIGRVNINFDYKQRYTVPVHDQREGAVYRVNNPYSNAHLFTPSMGECRSLLLAGWTYEGREWTAPTAGKPVYRLYNPYSHDHFYTSSRTEYDGLGVNGWSKEGVSFYTDDDAPVAVYRLWNPFVSEGTHHFTCDENEYRTLATMGWIQEGVSFHGVDR